ncbi:MAG: hypothetical protein QXH30_03400 [Candidatus Bilamarchaeaceae archaeon]
MNMEEKYVLCDSSMLISLTSSCLEGLLYFFRDKYGVQMLIPRSVQRETVDTPLSLSTKEHCFSAIRIKDMINDGVLKTIDEDVSAETKKIMGIANSIFYARGSPISLIHLGETEILALARKLDISSILIDERTARILIEDPASMVGHLQGEFRTAIMVNRQNLAQLAEMVKGMEVIRSTEVAFLGYEKGFFRHFDGMEKQAAEAALYKLKYAGCAISFKEIEEYARRL